MVEGKDDTLESKALWRHIRQHVHAPVHRFAVVVPVELSVLCRDEMGALGFSEAAITEAGVEFSGKLADCYKANLWLRTSSRIWCRMPSFRAGASEELFRKVSGVRWELWLNPELALRVDAHVESSRVQHEGMAADTVREGVEKRFKELGLPGPTAWRGDADVEEGSRGLAFWNQRLLVRLKDNRCEISLDTTGPHQHQRGYRLEHTGAPLRETLAAAILMKLGWTGDTPLVDGMCGAGTVPVEAALMARRSPPGLRRSFLFEKWPSFQTKTWEYLVRMAVGGLIDSSPEPIVAVDSDSEAIEIARRNGERAGVGQDVRWECMDFFGFSPRSYGLAAGLLVLNPPYGNRLKEDVGPLYQRLGAHIANFFQGWRVAVLAPSRSLATSLQLRTPRFWHIQHGGAPIVVAMGKV